MKSLLWSIRCFAVAFLMWSGAVYAADEGGTQDELVNLCNSNAAKLQRS